MMKPILHKAVIISLLTAMSLTVQAAQPLTDSLKREVGRTLTRIAEREVRRCPVSVNSIALRRGKVHVHTSVGMSYYPVREDNLTALCDSVRLLLPSDYRNREIVIISDGKSLADLIPFPYRSTLRKERRFTNSTDGGELVSRISHPLEISEGLEGRHIAIWQSHGRYFNQTINEWCWQRSLLWQTVEDLFTQSYVLPYLVPMLENAGANVMLPRERDYRSTELISDNDKGVDSLSRYAEYAGMYGWKSHDTGFAHLKSTYLSGENPFADGTSRTATTVTEASAESLAEWSVTVPQSGEYAVYVAYRTLPDSSSDALYTVCHAGGTTHFKVNQRIGGGTWIYLGTFKFMQGDCQKVVALSNLSTKSGQRVCADAVRLGGGYGNIARTVHDSLRVAGVAYEPATSGMPRYCEGSRYWLQWAGFQPSVYTPKNDMDDYKDDYMSRGEWVNALMGGSERLPKREGLGIPIDISLAFHSDAGITDNDTTIGTLGIFYTHFNKERFEGKVSRYRSRDLTDLVMTQIANDVAANFDSEWTRRGMWNRSYFEARVPSAPAMLLELLSHQNLADMRYGHDPDFKFTVSRAIYKAILRHISTQYDVPYCVAPLPVESFAAQIVGEREVELSWSPVSDSLEPTAKADTYILYTRINDGGFDNGRVVNGTSICLQQEPDIIYSYKITAANNGGESFPSEILSACIASKPAGKVFIINGFDRLSAAENDETGFHNDFDSGVAYLRDVAFIGEQRVFDTSRRREKNDYLAFGASHTDQQGGIVGGNTFDYPYLYGRSLQRAGYSFASASVRSVEQGRVDISQYDAINLILGKQRTTRVGRGEHPAKYRCFSAALQKIIADYLNGGGALFASGAYIGTDLFAGEYHTEKDIKFARETLHFDLKANCATRASAAETDVKRSPVRLSTALYPFCTKYCPECYTVNSTDALAPVGEGAYEMMRYPDNHLPAAVGYRGCGATFVMGFPFESITDEQSRDRLLSDIMNFLTDNQ